MQPVVKNKNTGPFLAFGPEWFKKHQRVLLRLLRFSLFRWIMRINCNRRIEEIGPHYYTVRLSDELWQTDFRTHWKYSKRVYYAFKPLWWTLHFWDWLVADRFAPQLSFGFLSLTVYPDPSFGATTVDGIVQVSSADSTWATIRAAAGTGAITTGTSTTVTSYQSSLTTNQWAILSRSIFTFDTSPLPNGATVTAATFSVAGSSKLDNTSSTPDVNVYGATPASNNNLVAADYGQLGSTAYCDTAIGYSSWSTSAYNDFVLNATGVAAIVDGITKLGCKNNYDASNVAPNWISNVASNINGKFADTTGTTSDPMLVVTYLAVGKFIYSLTRPRPFVPGLAR